MRAPYHRFFLDPPAALVFTFAFAFAFGMAFFARLPSPIAAIVKGYRRPDFALRLLTDLARGALRMQSPP